MYKRVDKFNIKLLFSEYHITNISQLLVVVVDIAWFGPVNTLDYKTVVMFYNWCERSACALNLALLFFLSFFLLLSFHVLFSQKGFA